MNAVLNLNTRAAERYARLRVALALFGTPPSELNATQAQQLQQQLRREQVIQQQILKAPQAMACTVPESVLEQAFGELKNRFEDEEGFLATLQHNDLDPAALREALFYELRVEAVLEALLAAECRIGDTELEIYYLQHLENFTLPETRSARQILITLNDDYAENSREQVEQRLREMMARIETITDFGHQAARHSECPTAMQEGVLGRVKPGQLFPSLEKALFALAEGEMSDIVESPLGMHLLWCEQIHPAETLPFRQVSDKLRDHLEQKARKRYLKRWLQQPTN